MSWEGKAGVAVVLYGFGLSMLIFNRVGCWPYVSLEKRSHSLYRPIIKIFYQDHQDVHA